MRGGGEGEITWHVRTRNQKIYIYLSANKIFDKSDNNQWLSLCIIYVINGTFLLHK